MGGWGKERKSNYFKLKPKVEILKFLKLQEKWLKVQREALKGLGFGSPSEKWCKKKKLGGVSVKVELGACWPIGERGIKIKQAGVSVKFEKGF